MRFIAKKFIPRRTFYAGSGRHFWALPLARLDDPRADAPG
jgi:hypothetical protein